MQTKGTKRKTFFIVTAARQTRPKTIYLHVEFQFEQETFLFFCVWNRFRARVGWVMRYFGWRWRIKKWKLTRRIRFLPHAISHRKSCHMVGQITTFKGQFWFPGYLVKSKLNFKISCILQWIAPAIFRCRSLSTICFILCEEIKGIPLILLSYFLWF